MASNKGKRAISIVLILVVGTILSLYILSSGGDSTDISTQIKVTGILEQGVEGGCLILKSDDGNLYTLIDLPDDTPPVGSRVTVTGIIQEDVVTSCMQGDTLRIISLSAIPRG